MIALDRRGNRNCNAFLMSNGSKILEAGDNYFLYGSTYLSAGQSVSYIFIRHTEDITWTQQELYHGYRNEI